MSKATMTVEGLVARDPEIREHNGKSVATVTVPHTARRKNQQTGQFEEVGDTLWVQASFWGDEARAVTQAARKGDLVTITGQPEVDVYTKNDGSTAAQLRLKFATLGVIPRAGRSQPVAQDQPWSTPGSAAADTWTAPAYDSDTTPF